MPLLFSSCSCLYLAALFGLRVVLLSRHLSFDSENLHPLRGMVPRGLPVFPVPAVEQQLLLLIILFEVRSPILPLMFSALQLFVLVHSSLVEGVVDSLVDLSGATHWGCPALPADVVQSSQTFVGVFDCVCPGFVYCPGCCVPCCSCSSGS